MVPPKGRQIMMRIIRPLIFIFIFTFLSVGVFHTTVADDDRDNNRHRNRYRERHRDDDHGRSYLNPVTDPTYKENCGGCHFAYQPELLPSGSWKMILGRLDDHFGESIDLAQQTKSVILSYLDTNAAEYSTANHAAKIMRSLRGQVPIRITKIPYISEKHREVSPGVFQHEAVGSLSNCIACHTTAEKGIYDDDETSIPR
jgi:hypothetical protein